MAKDASLRAFKCRRGVEATAARQRLSLPLMKKLPAISHTTGSSLHTDLYK